MKDGKAVNCNGSEIIGSIHLKYGKKVSGEIVPRRNCTQRNRTQLEWVRFLWRYGTLGTVSPDISYPGYNFSRDIVPYFYNVTFVYCPVEKYTYTYGLFKFIKYFKTCMYFS